MSKKSPSSEGVTQNLILTDVLISNAKSNGVKFGFGDPINRIRYFIKLGLLPNQVRKYENGGYVAYIPSDALDKLIKIQELTRAGYKVSKLTPDHLKYDDISLFPTTEIPIAEAMETIAVENQSVIEEIVPILEVTNTTQEVEVIAEEPVAESPAKLPLMLQAADPILLAALYATPFKMSEPVIVESYQEVDIDDTAANTVELETLEREELLEEVMTVASSPIYSANISKKSVKAVFYYTFGLALLLGLGISYGYKQNLEPKVLGRQLSLVKESQNNYDKDTKGVSFGIHDKESGEVLGADIAYSTETLPLDQTIAGYDYWWVKVNGENLRNINSTDGINFVAGKNLNINYNYDDSITLGVESKIYGIKHLNFDNGSFLAVEKGGLRIEGYNSQIHTDSNLYLDPDKDVYIGQVAIMHDAIGDREYTNEYFVTSGESITESINKLDYELGNFSGGGSSYWELDGNQLYALSVSYNVGIGTTDPQYKLDVNGSLNTTTFYLNGSQVTSSAAELNLLDSLSLTAGGIVYTNGSSLANTGAGSTGQCLKSNGSGAPAWDACVSGSGTTVPTGALGQTLYNDGSAWIASSNLFHNGTLVGIGTTNPQFKLDINGTFGTNGIVNLSGIVTGNASTASVLALDPSNNVELLDISAYDTNASNDLTTSTVFAGDLSGVYNNLQLGSGVVGATELASSGVTPDTYGDASNIPSFTVDTDGRITAVTLNAVSSYSGWTLAADSGSSQSISSGNTATFIGGTGISTIASATDNLTLSIETTEIATTTFGSGAGFTWTFDAGATDPTLALASNSIDITPGNGTSTVDILTGNLRVGNGTPTITQDGEDAYIEGLFEVDGNATFGGSIGVGTTAPSTTNGGIDIASGGMSLVLGADSSAITRTNATNKLWRIGGYHYTNAEEPMGFVFGQSTSTINQLNFGGGTALFNAATEMNFYTAANNTTTTGTSRMTINAAGAVGIGTTAPAYKLDVNGQARFGNSLAGTAAQVSIGKSSTWNSENTAGLRIEDGTQDTGLLLGADATNDVAYIQSIDPGTSYATRSLLINPNGGNVGIGTTDPASKLNSLSTTEQLRLSYDVSNYASFTTNSSGDLSLDLSGGDLTLASGDNLNLSTSSDLIFGGTTSLGETTGATDSGAYLVGVFDEFTYSSGANVQTILNDLDDAINTLSGGGYTGWGLGADTGTPETIANGDTALILGGTNGIDTSVSSTDTLTINLDTTEIGNSTFGAGSAYTWTFDASGGTDVTVAYGDGAITSTLSATGLYNVLVGNIKVGNGTPDVTLNGEDFYVEGTFEADGAARFDGAVSANSSLTIGGTTTANGVFALGDGGDTGAIDTSDWDISATGALTGISGIANDGGYTQSGSSTNTLTGNTTISGTTTMSGLASATAVNAAGGSANALTLSGTLGAFNGSDTFRGLYLNYTNANHTSTSNVFNGVDIAAITGDAEATETAINIGSGWDNGLVVNGVTVVTGTGTIASTVVTGTIFSTNSDSGSSTLVQGDTLLVSGTATGIDTSLSGDTYTISLDTTELATQTFGAGSAVTWTFDASGGTDVTTAYGDGSITNTLSASGLFNVLTGNVKVGNGTPDVSLNGEDAYVEGTFEADGAARFDGALSANSTLTVGGTTTLNGQFTLGDNGDTSSIDTSDWDISATGALTGISGITTDGGYTQSGSSANTLTGATTISGSTTMSGAASATLVNAAGGSANALTLSGTLGAFNGSDTFRGLYLNYTNANHTSTSNIFNGVDIAAITGDAEATETALNIGSGWDSALTVNGVTVVNGSGAIPSTVLTGTIFSTNSDSGSSTLVQGDTLLVSGTSTGIDTSLSGDTYTIALDTTEIGTTTFGSGSAITQTFDASGGTDVTTAYGDGSITNTLSATGLLNVLTGNLKIGNGTPTLTQNGEDAYVEGTFEVDGVSTFASNVGIGTTNPSTKLHVDLGTGLSGANTDVLKINGEGLTAGPDPVSGELAIGFGISKSSYSDSVYAGMRFSSTNGFAGSDPVYPTYTFAGSVAGNDINFWDGSIGLGVTNPSAKIQSVSTTEQLRLGYDSGNYTAFTTSSGGDLTVAPSGADLNITGNVDISGALNAATSNAFSVASTGATTIGAANSAGGSANALTLSGTLGAFNGSDTFRGLYLNYTNANHTSTSNIFNGVDIAAITGDAEATETAINIGSGWDSALTVNGVTVVNGSGAIPSTVITGTIFSTNSDSGSSTLVQGDTLLVSGTSTGIDTSLSGDTYTIALDTTELATQTFGAGSAVTFTFDASGGTDVTTAYGDGSITDTLSASGLYNVLTGNLKIGNGTPDVSLNGEDAYVEGTFEADGAARFDGALSANSTLTVAGTTALNGAFTLGDNGDTGAIDTSDWDISTTGALTGISGITTDGGYTQSGSNANTFTAATSVTPVNAAGGSANALTLSGTLGAFNGSDTFRGLYLNYTNANHTSTSNVFNGVDIAAITGDAEATETAINIGSGWDSGLTVNGVTVVNGSGAIPSTVLTGTIFSTNSDSGSSTLAQGDTLVINGGTNGINTTLSGDTYTLNIDTTEIGTTTFGAGSAVTWTFDASGGTDTTLAFGDGSISPTLSAAGLFNVLTGNLKVGNGTPTLTQDGEDAYVEGIFEVDGVATFGAALGVGTTDPAADLHVYGGNADLRVEANAGTASIDINNISSGDSMLRYYTNSNQQWAMGSATAYNDSFVIGQGSDLVTDSKFVIKGGGNVGIGTTDPTALLTVNGTGTFAGLLTGTAGLSISGASSTIANGDAYSLTTTSDLSGGARSAYPFIISQANDASNNNSVGLLQLNNQDTASTAAVLNITQAATSGTGLNFTSLTGGTSITVANTSGTALNANTITTGTGLTTTALTSGNAVVAGIPNPATTASALSVTNTANAVSADYTGAIINISPTRILSTASATRNESGNYLRISRTNSATGSGNLYNITGALASLSSTCSQTLGTCVDSSNILSLSQGYGAASGAVLNVAGAGTGNLAVLDATNSSANGVSIDIQSSSASQYALSTTSNNGSTVGLVVLGSGNVGIGTTDPTSMFSVGSTSQFQVNSSGAITASTGIANSGSYTQSGSSANTLTGATTLSGGVSSTLVNAAGGSANSLTLSGTLGAFNGSDTFRGLYLNYTNANHTSTSNIFNGVDIAAITGDAEATETAINIGSGWDNGLIVNGVTVVTGTGTIASTVVTGTIFSTNSDSGSSTLIQGDTLAINGGTNGVDTVLSGDTYTLNIDTTEIGTTTFGSGSAITQTFDASGGTDVTTAYGDGSISSTLSATGLFNVLTGNVKVGNGTPDVSLNGEDAYVEGTFEADGAARFDGALSANSTLTVAGTTALNGAFTLGDNGDTGAIDTSDWDISAAGTMTGISGITTNGGYTQSGSNANTFTAVTAITPVNAAGGSANALTLSGTLGIMDGSDTMRGLYLNYTNANHTSTSNVFNGVDIAAITGDAEATETAINIGSGWDSGLTVNGVTVVNGSGAIPSTVLTGTIFSTNSDSGSSTLVQGDTLLVSGTATGIDTSLSGDTYTIALDTTELATQTFGAGSAVTWTFDASGGTDTTLAFGDGSITPTLSATGLFNVLTGNLKIGNGTPTLTQNGEDAYIEGTFEVDGVSTFASNVGIGTTNPGYKLDVEGGDIMVNDNRILFDSSVSGQNVIQGAVDSGGSAAGSTTDLWIRSRYDDLVIQAGEDDSNKRNITLRPGLTGGGLVVLASGNVGVGTTAPSSLFSVGSTSQFQVNSSGAIAASTGIANSGSYTQSGSSANTLTGVTTLTPVNAASGSANALTLSGTLGVFNGSDTFRGLYLNYTNANHTSTSNVFNGVDIAAITGDADATETAISIGTGWDALLGYNGTTVINGSGQLVASQLTGTIFSTDSDSGSSTLIQGDTLVINGGTNGIDTVLSSDTYTLNLDTTEIGNSTFGAGSGFTWTFDAGATDPTLALASNSIDITPGNGTSTVDILTGNLRVGNGTPTITQDGEDAYIEGLFEVDGNATFGGSIGVGTTAPSTTNGGIDIASGGMSLVLGADSSAITRTNATNKLWRIGGYHYTNAEEPMGFVFGQSTSTINQLNFGGGTALFNAATEMNFYTAANNTTTTGTSRMTINAAGAVGIGTTAPAYKLDVNGQARFGNSLAGTAAQVSIGKSSTWNSENTAGLRIEDGTQDTGLLLGADATNDVAYIQSIDPGTSYATRSLLINPNGGNVGIGTTDPASKLDILDTSNTAAAFNLTNNTATTIGNGANTLGVLDLQSTSLTTGNFMNMELNALTTGKGINLTSTSTALSTANLVNLNWTPGSATTFTGDLFKLDVGANATISGNLFALYNNASAVFKVGTGKITSAVPHEFTAAGDVSFAYDAIFANQTASQIEAYGPLTIVSGESFENLDLTLKAYGTGSIVVDNSDIEMYTGQKMILDTNDSGDSYFAHNNGGNYVSAYADGVEVVRFNSDQSVDGNSTFDANAFDIAEYYPTLDTTVEAGDVVAIATPGTENEVVSSYLVAKADPSANSGQVLGIVSTKPGFSMGGGSFRSEFCLAVMSGVEGETQARKEQFIKTVTESLVKGEFEIEHLAGVDLTLDTNKAIIETEIEALYEAYIAGETTTVPQTRLDTIEDRINTCKAEKQVPIALSGRVPVKIDTNNGAIKSGDLLAASSTSIGKAMKATSEGWVIGRALEDAEEGKDTVMAYVFISWYNGNAASNINTDNSTNALDLDANLASMLNITTDGNGVKSLGVIGNLNTTGTVSGSTITASNAINTGLLRLSGTDNSINALGSKLYVQKDYGSLEVDFFNGKLVIGTDGSLVSVGKVQAKEIAAEQFRVLGSSTLYSSATVGEGTIESGTTELEIENTTVKSNSKVFITPTSKTDGRTLVVETKSDGKFTVTIDSAYTEDIKFDYWIVQVE